MTVFDTIKNLRTTKKKDGVEAKLVKRGAALCLVANFRCSRPPMVWNLDLKENHNFAITLRESGAVWELCLAVPQTGETPVARFAQKEEAEEAYEAMQKVMMLRRRGWLYATLRIVALALLVVFLLVGILVAFNALKTPNTANVAENEPSVVVQPAEQKPVKMENGVPMSADDVLIPPAE